MVLILTRNSFVCGQVGDAVIDSKWDPATKCEHSLLGLRQGNGDWSMFENGGDWLVVEANEEDVVDIADAETCKFRAGKIVYRGDEKGLQQYASVMATEENCAYYWAKNIGDKEIMRDRITKAHWIYEIDNLAGNLTER
jgi:hypothetical protein